MPITLEDSLREQLGQLMLQICMLRTENQALQEKLALFEKKELKEEK